MTTSKHIFPLSSFLRKFFLLIVLLALLPTKEIKASGNYGYGTSKSDEYWTEYGWSGELSGGKVSYGQSGYGQPNSGANPDQDGAGDEVRSYVVRYYPVGSIAEKLDKLFAPKAIIKDRMRHTITIKDTKEKCDEIGAFISQIDTEPSVILVEGSIIKVDMNKALEIGIKHQFDYSTADNLDVSSHQPGTTRLAVQSDLLSNGLTNLTNFALAIVSDSGDTYNVTLNALLKDGAAEEVLKPHITFISGTKGSFKQIENVPGVTSTQYGSNVDSSIIGLMLEVEGYHVPKEYSDEPDKIYLTKMKITDGVVGDQVATTSGGFQSSIAYFTTELKMETTQLVESGELITLGGSINRDRSEKISKFPILGDIPLIKYLFRYQKTEDKTVELVAFIRLSIVKDNSYAYKAAQFKNSRHLHPVDVGGSLHESIHEHPLSSAKWSSQSIYEEGLFFDRVHEHIPEDRQQEIKVAFEDRIRKRIKLVFKWNELALVRKLIYTDQGLEKVFVEMTANFQVAPLDILLVARHLGAINDDIYEIYYDYLTEKSLLEYLPEET